MAYAHKNKIFPAINANEIMLFLEGWSLNALGRKETNDKGWCYKGEGKDTTDTHLHENINKFVKC